jgi:hypothetical protein
LNEFVGAPPAAPKWVLAYLHVLPIIAGLRVQFQRHPIDVPGRIIWRNPDSFGIERVPWPFLAIGDTKVGPVIREAVIALLKRPV